MNRSNDLRGEFELFLVAAFDQIEENLLRFFQGLLLRVVEQFPDVDAERLRQFNEHVQGRIFFPPFDAAQILRAHPDFFGQCLLREPFGLAHLLIRLMDVICRFIQPDGFFLLLNENPIIGAIESVGIIGDGANCRSGRTK